MTVKRKLRYGMVGGEQNAFCGEVHRMAACFDGPTERITGAFSKQQ